MTAAQLIKKRVLLGALDLDRNPDVFEIILNYACIISARNTTTGELVNQWFLETKLGTVAIRIFEAGFI